MTHFSLTVDPFAQQMTIAVNGQPMASRSVLLKYIHTPLYRCCRELLLGFAESAGEPFDITVSTREEEAEILRYWADRTKGCTALHWQPLRYDAPITERARQLSAMVRHFPAYHPLRLNVTLLFSRKDSELFRLAQQIGVSSQALDIRMRCVTPDMGVQDNDLLIAVAQTEQELQVLSQLAARRSPGIVLYAGTKNAYLGEPQRIPCFMFMAGALQQALIRCLSLCLLPQALRQCAMQACQYAGQEQAMELLMLTSCDPVVAVRPVEIVELHACAELAAMILPAGAPMPALRVVSSEPQIISVSGMALRGEQVGSSVISVYQNNSVTPLTRFTVRVVRRNRVQEIVTHPNLFLLRPGMEQRFQVIALPEDADDLQALQAESSDDSVAFLRDPRTLVGSGIGKCMLRIHAERAWTEVPVTVAPGMTGYQVSEEAVSLLEGESMVLEICPLPRGAYPSALSYEMDDPMIASYDPYSRRLLALNEGTTILHIRNADTPARKDIPVCVQSAKRRRFGFLHR